jgi:hypothetical protein
MVEKKKIKEVSPYEFKEEYKEANPQKYEIGKKIKKVLRDIMKE